MYEAVSSSVHLPLRGRAFVTFHNTFGMLDMLWFVQLYLFLEVDSRPVMDHLLWRTKFKVNGVMLHELWLDHHVCIFITCGMYDQPWLILGSYHPLYNRPWISYSKPTHFFENPWTMAILFLLSPWGVSQSINIFIYSQTNNGFLLNFLSCSMLSAWCAKLVLKTCRLNFHGRNQNILWEVFLMACRNLNGRFQRSKGNRLWQLWCGESNKSWFKFPETSEVMKGNSQRRRGIWTA